MGRTHDEIGDSDDHNARGIELADRGWLDEAAREFQKAIRLDPKSAHAHDNLATIYAERGQLTEALVEFLEAVRLEPDSPTSRHYLASFLAAHGQDLAVAEYRKAIELEYDFPDAHLNLALSLADRGQLDEAIVELEVAHGQAPEDEMIQHELAGCLIEAQRYPEAIAHLKKIVREHPEHVEAYVDLGIAYTAKGFLAQAETVLKQAIGIDEHDFSAHYQLAALYAQWKKYDKAMAHLADASVEDAEKLADWLSDDPAFDEMSQDPRMEKLLQGP